VMLIELCREIVVLLRFVLPNHYGQQERLSTQDVHSTLFTLFSYCLTRDGERCESLEIKREDILNSKLVNRTNKQIVSSEYFFPLYPIVILTNEYLNN
jgi:hypothetical protein